MIYNTEIKEIRVKIDQEMIKKKLVQEEESRLENHLQLLTAQDSILRKARIILVEVGKLTQRKFASQVEMIVTKAIQTVFDRLFEFKVFFEEKRNKPECVLSILEGESEYIPKDDMGVGVIDIAGFILRIVLWSLQKHRTRNTFIYDEPLKAIGHDELMYRAGVMIKELSRKLGIQIIIVTHEAELIELADKAWEVTHDGIQSHLRIVKEQ